MQDFLYISTFAQFYSVHAVEYCLEHILYLVCVNNNHTQ